MAVANVPVTISIWHGKTKLQEYDEEIAVEFTDTTPEGNRNIQQCLYLTIAKGLSTEDAIFTIACQAAEAFSKQLVAEHHAHDLLELAVRMKRNGDISYAAQVNA
jgi:hypothetical protein